MREIAWSEVLLGRDEQGATAVEYALIAALIAGVIVGTLILLGPQVADLYQSATDGW